MGFLSPDELRRLTDCARRTGQEAWLRSEGVPYKLSRTGQLLVCWVHVHAWMEGRPTVSFIEPDFSSLGG